MKQIVNNDVSKEMPIERVDAPNCKCACLRLKAFGLVGVGRVGTTALVVYCNLINIRLCKVL